MSTPPQDFFWLNRPASKEYAIPYEAPPADANPVVRGLPLYYAGSLVARLGFIQSFLWRNAGFDRLRGRRELEYVDPRYEPNVIRTSHQPPSSADGISALLGEDWQAKRLPSNIYPSVLDYHEAFKAGSLTPSALAEALLPLVLRNVPNKTKHSTAFLETQVDLVRQAAAESTQRYADGKPLSPLDGVPVAIKDEQDITGYSKSLGSKIDYTDKNDATSYCVQLWQDAGAVVLGKTNMHELGMDTTNNNPVWGTPLNPHNDRYYCGGSSGGSAYVVAAGLTPVAMGNDGGGSIRIPSAYCGIYGLKTSHGRASIRPTSNETKSTGVAGPMAANMVDLEISYRLMCQPDPLEQDAKLFVPPARVDLEKNRRKVIGIYKTWFDRADPEVKKSCQDTIDYLTKNLGYETVYVDIPLVHDGQLAHAMTILVEGASAVAHVNQLSPANQILIAVGSQTSGVDIMQAQKLRNLLMKHLAHLYEQHPGMIILTATTPNPGISFHPADLKHGVTDANTEIRNMEYVWMANLVGCPAITVPVAYVEPVVGTGKVPIGLMGMGEWCSEDELLAFGYDVERYLNNESPQGRVKPFNFVNPIEVAAAES
ncbi:Hypothetical protein R9X50_00780600 [Acrodontium crateriforme]|uniref:Amidase domain-containing protein n=1 Tax=Acrodontium crateriforme TaxID=150365 RepID=A0AAQ3MAR8_9PEZI|nr:Hypothetical protein R9X50_00780600 [Acrodontium crateriforme]